MESWYFWQLNFLNLWDFRETTTPLKIPTPTPAPNRGGPVACLSGPKSFCGSVDFPLRCPWSRALMPENSHGSGRSVEGSSADSISNSLLSGCVATKFDSAFADGRSAAIDLLRFRVNLNRSIAAEGNRSQGGPPNSESCSIFCSWGHPPTAAVEQFLVGFASPQLQQLVLAQ